MTDDEGPKILDLTIRREEQISHDAVTDLADALCEVVAAYAPEMTPADQLIAIELTARSAVETFRLAFGEEILNAIFVDVNHRALSYQLSWHSDEQREAGKNTEDAEVVPLRSVDGEDEDPTPPRTDGGA
jgi:hypothetical protein